MKDRWQELQKRFHEISIREKIIVVGAIFVASYLLIDMVVIAPTNAAYEKAKKQHSKSEQKIADANKELNLYQDIIKKDPNSKLIKEREQLEEKLKVADRSLETMSLKLIEADKLPEILADVLRAKGNLQLNSLLTLDAIRIDVKEEKEKIPSEIQEHSLSYTKKSEGAYLYRHGARITFSGAYFDVLHYLSILEKQNKRFYWDAIDYKVTEYPSAEIQMDVYTLALGKGALSG